MGQNTFRGLFVISRNFWAKLAILEIFSVREFALVLTALMKVSIDTPFKYQL